MEFNDLSEEQKAKALACKTPEELLALAKAEGYDLDKAELEAIVGRGLNCDHGWLDPRKCSKYVC